MSSAHIHLPKPLRELAINLLERQGRAVGGRQGLTELGSACAKAMGEDAPALRRDHLDAIERFCERTVGSVARTRVLVWRPMTKPRDPFEGIDPARLPWSYPSRVGGELRWRDGRVEMDA